MVKLNSVAILRKPATSIIANNGQVDSSVLHYAHVSGGKVYLTAIASSLTSCAGILLIPQQRLTISSAKGSR
jgi:hypothetical protein